MINDKLLLESLKLINDLNNKDSEKAAEYRNKIMLEITTTIKKINKEIKELLKDKK